jgi:hypothetical protein
MQRKTGFGIGAFLLVAGFVWIVFDNLVLGLIFGMFAGLAANARRPDAKPGA